MADATARVRVDVNTQELREAKQLTASTADRWRDVMRDQPQVAQGFRQVSTDLRGLEQFAQRSTEALKSMKPTEYERLSGILKRNLETESAITGEYTRRREALEKIRSLSDQFRQNSESFYGDLVAAGEQPRALGGVPGIEATLAKRAEKAESALRQVEDLRARYQEAAGRVGGAAPAEGGAGGHGGGHLGSHLMRELLGTALALAGVRGIEGTVGGAAEAGRATYPNLFRAGLIAGRPASGLYTPYSQYNEGNQRSREFLQTMARAGVSSDELARMTREHAVLTGETPKAGEMPEFIGRLARFGARATGSAESGMKWHEQAFQQTYLTEGMSTAMMNALLKVDKTLAPGRMQELMQQNVHLIAIAAQQAGGVEGATTAQLAGLATFQSELAGVGAKGRGAAGIERYEKILSPEGMPGLGRMLQMQAFQRATGRSPVASLKDMEDFRDMVERGGMTGLDENAKKFRMEMLQGLRSTGAQGFDLRRVFNMRAEQFEPFLKGPMTQDMADQFAKTAKESGRDVDRELGKGEARALGIKSIDFDELTEASKRSAGALGVYADAIERTGKASIDMAQYMLDRAKAWGGENPNRSFFGNIAASVAGMGGAAMLSFPAGRRALAAGGRAIGQGVKSIGELALEGRGAATLGGVATGLVAGSYASRGIDQLEGAMRTGQPGGYRSMVRQMAAARGLSEDEVDAYEALIEQESHFDPSQVNKSDGGMGLGQIMPDNWRRLGKGSDPMDPEANLNVSLDLFTSALRWAKKKAPGDPARQRMLAWRAYQGSENMQLWKGRNEQHGRDVSRRYDALKARGPVTETAAVPSRELGTAEAAELPAPPPRLPDPPRRSEIPTPSPTPMGGDGNWGAVPSPLQTPKQEVEVRVMPGNGMEDLLDFDVRHPPRDPEGHPRG